MGKGGGRRSPAAARACLLTFDAVVGRHVCGLVGGEGANHVLPNVDLCDLYSTRVPGRRSGPYCPTNNRGYCPTNNLFGESFRLAPPTNNARGQRFAKPQGTFFF